LQKYQTNLEDLKTTSIKLDEEFNSETTKLQLELKKYDNEINQMKEEIQQIETKLSNKE